MWTESVEILNPYDNIKILKTKGLTLCRCGKLESGDSFVITKSDKNYNVGDYYHNKHFIITKVFYKPKPWWKFWEKKEVLAYSVMFMGDN